LVTRGAKNAGVLAEKNSSYRFKRLTNPFAQYLNQLSLQPSLLNHIKAFLGYTEELNHN
jgi:hypothetical protein